MTDELQTPQLKLKWYDSLATIIVEGGLSESMDWVLIALSFIGGISLLDTGKILLGNLISFGSTIRLGYKVRGYQEGLKNSQRIAKALLED